MLAAVAKGVGVATGAGDVVAKNGAGKTGAIGSAIGPAIGGNIGLGTTTGPSAAGGKTTADELGATELGASELGASELGAGELGAGELGAGELGAGEVGAGEVGAGEVGAGPGSATARGSCLTAEAGGLLVFLRSSASYFALAAASSKQVVAAVTRLSNWAQEVGDDPDRKPLILATARSAA
jgi:hypothetical protein